MSRPVAIDPDSLVRAGSILRAGGVVAFPTETYYGLAVDPFHSQALDRLFGIKQRSRTMPILVLVTGEEQLPLLAESVPALYKPLMRHFWPGPLTLIFPARASLPVQLTGGTGTVGIRRSPESAANRLLAAFGGPITATSANLSGERAAVTADEVDRIFGDRIDCILDGGATPGGGGSTLVGIRDGALHCLREGAIAFAQVFHRAGFEISIQQTIHPVTVMADLQWNKDFALEQTAGDEELLAELLTLFRESSAQDLEQLRQAVATDNAAQVVTAAHSLKGASASLGLEGIRQLALAMESNGRAGSSAAANAANSERNSPIASGWQ